MFFCQYCEILRKLVLRKNCEWVLLNCIVGNKVEGRISRRFFKENKTRQIFWGGAKNVRFSKKLPCFVFLKHPFLDLPFSLITDCIKKVEWNPKHSL